MINIYHELPNTSERFIDPPEPMPEPERDRLFEALDTLRHGAFALQNRIFSASPEACGRLERLLAQNKADQAALRCELSQYDCIL